MQRTAGRLAALSSLMIVLVPMAALPISAGHPIIAPFVPKCVIQGMGDVELSRECGTTQCGSPNLVVGSQSVQATIAGGAAGNKITGAAQCLPAAVASCTAEITMTLVPPAPTFPPAVPPTFGTSGPIGASCMDTIASLPGAMICAWDYEEPAPAPDSTWTVECKWS